MKKTIVFLYTELADYIKVCMERLALNHVEVHVFHYPVNPEAPFEFDFKNSPCHFYLRTHFSHVQLRNKILDIHPSAIVCSGWVDSDYVNICRELKPNITTVVAIDNQYQPGLKPLFSRLRAQFFYKSAFRFAWVPGRQQVKYAEKIGFKPSEIHTGFYTIDVNEWNYATPNKKDKNFPKRFVFMGRYLKFKGVVELWEAFSQLNPRGWELYCAGSGDLYASRLISKGIHHIGFVQPTDLGTFVAQGGVFILPSHKEPWGVVVHEFAAAGYPIICTTKVGAASAFVKNGMNGFVVKPKSVEEIKLTMEKIIEMSDEELVKMGEESRALAEKINVEQWVATALQFIEKK